MELKPGLHRTDSLDVEAVRRQAEEAGYATFVLPAKGVVDKSSFCDAVRATFPLDPPILGPTHNWDALYDSLSNGLGMIAARRILILWPNAGAMETLASPEFEIALSVLANTVSVLADFRATAGNPKEVAVLVA